MPGLDARAHEPGRTVEGERAVAAGAAVVQERGNATRAVAALLDLVAVGVENPVEHRRAARRGRSSTSAWSKPMPVRRSARLRSSSGRSTDWSAGASNTTKSLPTPCIFVKSMRIATQDNAKHRARGLREPARAGHGARARRAPHD